MKNDQATVIKEKSNNSEKTLNLKTAIFLINTDQVKTIIKQKAVISRPSADYYYLKHYCSKSYVKGLSCQYTLYESFVYGKKWLICAAKDVIEKSFEEIMIFIYDDENIPMAKEIGCWSRYPTFQLLDPSEVIQVVEEYLVMNLINKGKAKLIGSRTEGEIRYDVYELEYNGEKHTCWTEYNTEKEIMRITQLVSG